MDHNTWPRASAGGSFCSCCTKCERYGCDVIVFVVVDVRYLTKTAEQVAALGDVKYMIVTGRDNAHGK